MKGKTVFGIMLTLLLTGVQILSVYIQPVKATGTIYIRADGSVDPPTAPIQRVGDIYTFTDSIYDSIVVEKNSIIINGAGYTLQGSGSGNGFSLSSISNVTIKSTNIKGFWNGLYLATSSENNILGNNITNNVAVGVRPYRSSFNIVSRNNITSNGAGVYVLSSSNNNTIFGNKITSNSDYGVALVEGSNNNTVSGNDITNNFCGVRLSYSSRNTVSGNNIRDSTFYGVWLYVSSNNRIYYNNFINNTPQQVNFSYVPLYNAWDDGYPSGGNYWSDYTGVDNYSGPNQDQLGSDGIGDTPYVINEQNMDRYPLMNQWWKYALTISTTIGGTTSPTPGTYFYTPGTLVSVLAISDVNFVFDHWELNGINVGAANPMSVTMNTNHALRVFFKTGLTFPIGTFVIPMDEKQNLLTTENVTVYGFIWAILDGGADIYRIIEPPDITLQTTTYPGGAVYSGGVVLVMSTYGGIIGEKKLNFPNVTVDTLTEPFTSSPNQLFFVEKPTRILVIYGVWGHTEETLGRMAIPFTLVYKADVEANAKMIFDYDLVVVDCPGWWGSMPDHVVGNFTLFASQGAEVVFTDIALLDLAQVYPGYVNVVGNLNWIGNVSIHNPPLTGFSAEFPSQYPTTFPHATKIYTMGGGQIVDTILNPTEVRVLMDTKEYGGSNRTLAFYFPYGNGLVEGFAYHPQEQTEDVTFDPYSYVVSSIFYGNKFIHAIPPAAVDWWPMWRHDARRTGYSTSSAPNTNNTLWTYSASGYAMVAVDGMVFLTTGNTPRALNATTGQLIWCTPTPFTSGGIAVAYNTVFIQDWNGVLYTLDEYTGALKWNVTGLGGAISPAVADGMVFGRISSGVYAVNATTGALKWSRSLGYTVYSTPAVDSGMVFTATWGEGKVYALNESTGSIIWSSVTLTSELEATSVVVDNSVYTGGGNGVVYVLDKNTGALIRTYGPVGGYLNQGPTVAYGKLFVGTDGSDKTVYAIDEATGAIVWSYYVGGGSGYMVEPRVADHKVFAASGHGPSPGLYALDESNGQLIWSFKLPTTDWVGDIIIANGMAFAIIGNTTYAFGPPLSAYTLTISTTAGGTTDPAPETYTYAAGTVMSVTAIPDSGYFLDHWELDGKNVGATNPISVTMNMHHTLRAVFSSERTLTITTTSGGTTNPAPGLYTYPYGTVVDVTAIANPGYSFNHWDLDGSNVGAANPISVTMDADHALHAVFVYSVTIDTYCNTEGKAISVSITMDGNPTGFNTPHTFTGLTGPHTFTLPTSDPSGHPFKQWSTGQTSTTVIVSSPGTYTAYYGTPPPVGGVVVSLDKLGLLGPYIGLALIILVAAVASTIYVKRLKRREDKQ